MFCGGLQLSLPTKLSATGALDWDGADEFGVQVDGTTIRVNGSNELEVIGGGGGGGGVTVALDASWGNGLDTGTIETHIGTVYIAAGDYDVRAVLGCQDPSDAATIKLRKTSDGTVLDTIGGVAGGLGLQTTTWTVADAEEYDILGYCDVSSAVGLAKSLYLELVP